MWRGVNQKIMSGCGVAAEKGTKAASCDPVLLRGEGRNARKGSGPGG